MTETGTEGKGLKDLEPYTTFLHRSLSNRLRDCVRRGLAAKPLRAGAVRGNHHRWTVKMHTSNTSLSWYVVVSWLALARVGENPGNCLFGSAVTNCCKTSTINSASRKYKHRPLIAPHHHLWTVSHRHVVDTTCCITWGVQVQLVSRGMSTHTQAPLTN